MVNLPDQEGRSPLSDADGARPDYRWPSMKDGELELLRKRQRDRARIFAVLLAAFVVLMFFITIAKTSINW